MDKKERLLQQLRSMNDEAERAGPGSGRPTDDFQRAYADVVMQLKQVMPTAGSMPKKF